MDGGSVLENAKKLDIMVIRVDYKNKLVNARPCYQCLLMMKNIGINKVYYSIDNTVVCEKISDMISINSSDMLREINYIITGNNDTFTYYKKIIDLMPKSTKKKNAELFLKSVIQELPICKYILTNDKLMIHYEELLLATIIII